jgi:hypothetical protein
MKRGVILPYTFMLKLNRNSCISFQSDYDMFNFNYNQDLYFYGSKHRREVKKRYNLLGIVEDHHVIPKSLEKHPLIVETKFPIHCSKNIKMMPSIKNKDVADDILIHSYHQRYNMFIEEKLNEIYEKKPDKKTSINELLLEMDKKLNYKDLIPWN